jgi:hypothetical protein
MLASSKGTSGGQELHFNEHDAVLLSERHFLDEQVTFQAESLTVRRQPASVPRSCS